MVSVGVETHRKQNPEIRVIFFWKKKFRNSCVFFPPFLSHLHTWMFAQLLPQFFGTNHLCPQLRTTNVFGHGHTHAHAHTLALALSLSLSHTHTHMHTHTLTHSLTHSLAHIRTHTGGNARSKLQQQRFHSSGLSQRSFCRCLHRQSASGFIETHSLSLTHTHTHTRTHTHTHTHCPKDRFAAVFAASQQVCSYRKRCVFNFIIVDLELHSSRHCNVFLCQVHSRAFLALHTHLLSLQQICIRLYTCVEVYLYRHTHTHKHTWMYLSI